VSSKEGLEKNNSVNTAIKEAELSLQNTGRIFVRASGTEPLVRVMVEGPDKCLCETLAEKVAEVISKELG
jgi:phosphoglucosamine mutase